LPSWKSTFDNPLLNITDMFRHKPLFLYTWVQFSGIQFT